MRNYLVGRKAVKSVEGITTPTTRVVPYPLLMISFYFLLIKKVVLKFH